MTATCALGGRLVSSRFVFFIPGIFGSELSVPGGTIWPPSVADFIGSYFDQSVLDSKLRRRDNVTVGSVIRKAGGNQVYARILDRLSQQARALRDERVIFEPIPYDWRQSVLDCARQVGQSVTAAFNAHNARSEGSDVVIVAHSMGGLVARMLLETDLAREMPWVGSVRGLIAIGTPHRGSVDAMMAVGGRVSQFGLKGETIRRLVVDGVIESLVDLLPPREQLLIVQQDGLSATNLLTTSQFLQRHDEAIWARYNRNNRTSALLGLQRPNDSVPYICVASATHKTAVRLHRLGTTLTSIPYLRAGDGRVAIDSVLLPNAVPIYAKGDHTTVCDEPIIETIIFQLLGLPAALVPFDGAAGTSRISISPPEPELGDGIEIFAEYSEYEVGDQVEVSVYRMGELGRIEVYRAQFFAPELWLKELAITDAGDYLAVLTIRGVERASRHFSVTGV